MDPGAFGALWKLVFPCSLHIGFTRAAGGVCPTEEVSPGGAYAHPFTLKLTDSPQLSVTRSCSGQA